jgi:hypothetical protein
LQDRYFPRRLNRKLGIEALLQTVPLIAEPLPDGLETFGNFAEFRRGFSPVGSKARKLGLNKAAPPTVTSPPEAKPAPTAGAIRDCCAGQKQQHFRQREGKPGLPTILDLREVLDEDGQGRPRQSSSRIVSMCASAANQRAENHASIVKIKILPGPLT